MKNVVDSKKSHKLQVFHPNSFLKILFSAIPGILKNLVPYNSRS